MDVSTAARALIGDTLAFHLLFVTFGVALPLIICVTEGYGIWKKKPRARALAHTWSRILVILFIAGAVSGTIVSMQFSLLWPHFMEIAGKVVGLAFALEGFAFLIEALFLSIYMLSWNKFKPVAHWLCSLPIVLGSVTSAVFITSVNAWMQTPRGFSLNAKGEPININTREAVFNPAVPTEVVHSILAYFFATTLALLAVYAWIAWRRKRKGAANRRLQRLLGGLAALAVVFGLLVAFAGDRSGKFIAEYEPHKLAAAEGLQTTQNGAPLLLGGVIKNGQIQNALSIPKGLSFLATGNLNAEVKGLDSIPKKDRPPLVIHYYFDGMVAIGMITVAWPALYLLLRKFKPAWAKSKVFLIGFVVCGFLGMVALELGWMLTEFGRQPYVIRGVLLVKDAATHSKAAIHMGYIFPVFYLILFVLTYFALKKGIKPMEALDD